MRIVRGVASLVAGFLVLPLLMRIGLTAVLTIWPGLLQSAGWLAPSVPGPPGLPSTDFMVLNLGLTLVMSGIAAVLTALIAPEPPFLWVLLLAFLVFTGGLVFGVRQYGGPTPTWYLLGLPLANGLGIATGGWLFLAWRDRRSGETG
ncbi:MAG: hypothetical protein PVF05_01920 [Gemmatimonadales bacterium]